jgi:two-component sensor histidine kinase
MKDFLKPFFLFLCLGIFLFPSIGWSQENNLESKREKDFGLAMEYLAAFKNDSANYIFTQLIDELTINNELESAFGLQVQLRQAEVLEKDHQDEIAIQKLIKVVEISQQKNEWEVFANAHLSLARLNEKIGRSTQCLEYLEKARTAISEHKLENIYPRFAIRYSSYHRIFSNQDSSFFFANEVVRTAPKFNLDDEEATGYLLMGLLLRDSSYQKANRYFQQAGNIFKRLEDYSGYSATLNNLSRLHIQNNQNQLALLYNDSSLIAANQATINGYDGPWMYYTHYHDRAKILQEMEQYDSAWHYLHKAYQLEMADISNFNNDKVIAIDARYQNEKKAQKIEEQAMVISYEKSRRNLMSSIIFLVILFSTILAYYYLKLRNANKKTVQQAVALTEVNKDLSVSLEQQILLQGEVHHRVKNNLQIIISLLELQREDIIDVKARESMEVMSNRIYSMAAIHEMLYQNKGKEMVNLLDYTKSLCAHFRSFTKQSNSPIFQLEIDEIFFNLQTLMPLGIILNELLTNSLKYAVTPDNKLRIGIKLEPVDDGFILNYCDNGPGFPEETLSEDKGGLGTYLLKSMSRQLGGHLTCMNDQGAVCKIFFKEKNK